LKMFMLTLAIWIQSFTVSLVPPVCHILEDMFMVSRSKL
jgi:hypothetical protein